MDFALLVEEITRLVCERLAESADGMGGYTLVAPTPPSRTASVLVILGRSAPAPLGGFDYQALAGALTTLAQTAPVRFHVLPSSRFPGEDLAARLPAGAFSRQDEAADWGGASLTHEALLLPNAGVGVLAKLALLIADEPAVEAALQFLLQNKPVLVGWDDVQMLLSHEGYQGRGIQDVLRNHVRAVQALGIGLGVGPEPCERLAAVLGAKGHRPPLTTGKAVVTQDDVHELAKRGQKQVIYPPGSIVTALAWEAASRLGIEITLQ